MNVEKNRVISIELKRGILSPLTQKEVSGKELRDGSYVAFTEFNAILATISDKLDTLIHDLPDPYDQQVMKIKVKVDEFWAHWDNSNAKKLLELILPNEIPPTEYSKYF
jgi:hypothetical protein